MPKGPKSDRLPADAIGILAYGSLIDDPGEEIAAVCSNIIKEGIFTPFNVEFARTSRTRKGAPTLVPVAEGGLPVRAAIIVVNVSTPEATNMLWRRETRRVGKLNRVYQRPSIATRDDVIVEELSDFHGIQTVLYTRIGANIEPGDRSAKSLAKLAIASAQALTNDRDGISYLIATKKNGIRTALSEAYETEIKKQTNTASLEEAVASARKR